MYVAPHNNNTNGMKYYFLKLSYGSNTDGLSNMPKLIHSHSYVKYNVIRLEDIFYDL